MTTINRPNPPTQSLTAVDAGLFKRGGQVIPFLWNCPGVNSPVVKVDLGIWNKLTWAVILLGFLAGIALVAGSYLPLINQNERMRRKIDEMASLIQREEDTAKSLRESIDALQHDPRTVERTAREILLYDKPGETVIRYSAPDSNGVPESDSAH